MEELPKRKKYLRTFLSSHASLEDGQHLLQEPSGKTDSNISTFGLPFTYG